jgi:hypothetical protein
MLRSGRPWQPYLTLAAIFALKLNAVGRAPRAAANESGMARRR